MAGKAGMASWLPLALVLTGCGSDKNRPHQGDVYVTPAAPGTVGWEEDDYLYYPNYQVYYSQSRRQYAYREGNAWVVRPAPQGVTVNVLRASPSVRMNFHDSPAKHDAAVVQEHPKNWSPPGPKPDPKENPKDNHHKDHDDNNGK